MSKKCLTLKITNVSAVLRLGVELDLSMIAYNGHDVEYNSNDVFLMTTLRKPLLERVHIYASGAMTVHGAKSIEDAKLGARIIARRLQKLDLKVRIKNFRIVNIFTKSSVPYDLDLKKIADSYSSGQVIYHPESDPILYYYSVPNQKKENYNEIIKFTTKGRIIIFAADLESMSKLAATAFDIANNNRLRPTKQVAITVYSKPPVVDDDTVDILDDLLV